MLNGVSKLINAYGDSLNDDTFKEKLSRVSVKEISRTAKDRHNGSIGFAEALLIYYNKKNKSALKWETLYTHKIRKNKENQTAPEQTNSEDTSDNVPRQEDHSPADSTQTQPTAVSSDSAPYQMDLFANY